MLIRILCVFLILLISSCAYYSQMTVPGESVIRSDSEVIAHIEDSENGFRFLTLPVTIPSSSNIIKKNLESNQGNGIKNLEVTFSEFNLGIISFPSVKVKFDIIKVTMGNQNVTHLIDKSESQSAEIPTISKSNNPNFASVKISAQSIEIWRNSINSLLTKTQFNNKWLIYKSLNNLKISKEEWTNSLTEQDYLNYSSTTKPLEKWLSEELEKNRPFEKPVVKTTEDKELVPVPTTSAQTETSTKSQNIKPLDEWQIDISKLLENELYKEWWYFGKKYKINASASEWSKTLSINDYQQYLDSGLDVKKWLGERLEKSNKVEQISQGISGHEKSDIIEKWELISTKSHDGKIIGPESGLRGNLILTKNKNVKIIFDQSGKKTEFEGTFYYDEKGSMVIEVEQIGVQTRSKICYKSSLIQENLLILITETGREYHWKK